MGRTLEEGELRWLIRLNLKEDCLLRLAQSL